MINATPHPQSIQQALNACDQAHTGVHRAIAALKAGAHLEAKDLIAKQIAYLANTLSVL